jgi:methyl-accepting chemotaxis protein
VAALLVANATTIVVAVVGYDHDSRLWIVLATVAGILVSFGAGLWIATTAVTKLNRLCGALEAVSQGDYTVRVEVDSSDEVGVMSAALNRAIDGMRTTLQTMDHTASSLATSSAQLADVSTAIASGTGEASNQAELVAAAAEEVSRNVQAVRAAESTNQAVSRLGDSSAEIGNVLKLITSIAEQTNLLALNATIEAARAGEAGKGFAVVANEVKDLAQETARATEDISRRVEAIQTDTASAVAAIGQISQIIAQINDYQLTIASAVEEQTATTNEMSRSVAEAASGSVEIANNVADIAQTNRKATQSVGGARHSAAELARMSDEMNVLVARFKV